MTTVGLRYNSFPVAPPWETFRKFKQIPQARDRLQSGTKVAQDLVDDSVSG